MACVFSLPRITGQVFVQCMINVELGTSLCGVKKGDVQMNIAP